MVILKGVHHAARLVIAVVIAKHGTKCMRAAVAIVTRRTQATEGRSGVDDHPECGAALDGVRAVQAATEGAARRTARGPMTGAGKDIKRFIERIGVDVARHRAHLSAGDGRSKRQDRRVACRQHMTCDGADERIKGRIEGIYRDGPSSGGESCRKQDIERPGVHGQAAVDRLEAPAVIFKGRRAYGAPQLRGESHLRLDTNADVGEARAECVPRGPMGQLVDHGAGLVGQGAGNMGEECRGDLAGLEDLEVRLQVLKEVTKTQDRWVRDARERRQSRDNIPEG
jgi:hypothetical protein